MNKFDELQMQIENIIASLNRQIKAKQDRINELNESINADRTHIYDLNEFFNEASKKRDLLSKIEGKNIYFYVIKELTNELVKEFLGYVKNKQWG